MLQMYRRIDIQGVSSSSLLVPTKQNNGLGDVYLTHFYYVRDILRDYFGSLRKPYPFTTRSRVLVPW
jgi:hypothetical protein